MGEIENAGRPEPGLAADRLVHAAPKPQRLDGQRDLPGIAALLPAKTPIAARLLAANNALLDDGDGYALLRQEHRRRNPGDAAADDHHIGAAGKGRAGGEGIDGAGHDTVLLPVEAPLLAGWGIWSIGPMTG